jgi:predicted double-glycine peptidase
MEKSEKAARDFAALARRAERLQGVEKIVRGGSALEVDALAKVIRDVADLFAALEYELLEFVTVSENGDMGRQDGSSRLFEVARNAAGHVQRATRCEQIARNYREVLEPWFTQQRTVDLRGAIAFFKAFIPRAESAASTIADWVAEGAAVALEATNAARVRRARKMTARGELIRLSLIPGLQALARVGRMVLAVKDHPIPHGAIKVPVPEVRQQTDWSCGSSSLQAVCGYYGVGPTEEWEVSRDLGTDHRIGAQPFQLIRTARGYGLDTEELRNQTDTTQLRTVLDTGRPILIMIQAWGDPDKFRDAADYARVWNEGHWVVAIGSDVEGVFFEDPSLAGIRGYLSNSDLELRWRDIGPHNRYMPGFGIVMWKRGVASPAYFTRARHIG